MSLTVSIITPSCNQGRYIERTIESVLSQSGERPREHVVYDGGSTDETLNILRTHEPAVHWTSEPDSGQAHAVNKGIQATSGELIGWLNSDDIYLPGAVQAVQIFFENNPHVDVVYGDAHYIDEEDRPIEPYPTQPWSFKRLLERCYLCQPSVFFRRRMIDRFGLLDERLTYCLDYEYWLRLAAGGAAFAYLPRVLAGARLYSESKTVRDRLNMHDEVNDMLKRKFGRVPDQWLLNYGHAAVLSKGIPHADLLRSRLAVFIESWSASMRWNKRPSTFLIRRASQWLRQNGARAVREAFTP